MANNSYTGTDGIVFNNTTVGVGVKSINDTNETYNSLGLSTTGAVSIGYEQMMNEKQCLISANTDIYFKNASKQIGYISSSNGSFYLNNPKTTSSYGFYIDYTLNTSAPILYLESGTDATAGLNLHIGNSNCGTTVFQAGKMVRFTNGITTSATTAGIFSTNGDTSYRYLYFNSNNNLIIGSNTFTSTNIYIFNKANSYGRLYTAGGGCFYPGIQSICDYAINIPGTFTFKVAGETVAPVSVTVTRNTTNTTAVSGYVYYYPILNIVQVNLDFTMKTTLTASTLYTVGTISSTYAPVVTAGVACHVNTTSDHSTGIINSSGTISLYADAAATSARHCYISGVYSTV